MQQEIEFTEAELTGEDIPDAGKEAAAPEPTPEPEKGKEPEPGKETAAEPVKPPVAEERRVPLKELVAERQRRQELQAKLEALEKEKPPEKDPAALILEDPEEAVRLLMSQNQQLRDDITRRELEREIKAEVPDFFDKAPQMEELLLGEGLSEETIRNMIGATGIEAPKLFKVLSKLVETGVDPKAARERIEGELIPKITADVTKQLMAKFNIVDQGVNIGNLPGTPPDGKMIVDGERGYAGLTPDQQEKWLRGEI